MADLPELSEDDKVLMEALAVQFLEQAVVVCHLTGGDFMAVAARLDELGRRCRAEAEEFAELIEAKNEWQAGSADQTHQGNGVMQ